MFGLGLLFYTTVLLLNAVAILNEERFLARLVTDESPSFGGPQSDTIKARLLALVRAVRTVMRRKYSRKPLKPIQHLLTFQHFWSSATQ